MCDVQLVRIVTNVSGTECARKVTRVATEVRKAMNHPDRASFMAAQITIASGYLDRAMQSAGEASSGYLHYARQAYEIVMQLLPQVNLNEAAHEKSALEELPCAFRREFCTD
jgi:hypothetical protein